MKHTVRATLFNQAGEILHWSEVRVGANEMTIKQMFQSARNKLSWECPASRELGADVHVGFRS